MPLLRGELVPLKLKAGLTWLDFVLLEHDLIIRTPVPFITFVFFGSESFALARFNITSIIYGIVHMI